MFQSPSTRVGFVFSKMITPTATGGLIMFNVDLIWGPQDQGITGPVENAGIENQERRIEKIDFNCSPGQYGKSIHILPISIRID